MLDQNGVVQILDFGIAVPVDPGAPEAAVVAGTPEYMAPEVRSRGATPASDIYSMGLVLFELVTGRKAAPLFRAGTDPRVALEEVKDEVAQPLREVILRCL